MSSCIMNEDREEGILQFQEVTQEDGREYRSEG